MPLRIEQCPFSSLILMCFSNFLSTFFSFWRYKDVKTLNNSSSIHEIVWISITAQWQFLFFPFFGSECCMFVCLFWDSNWNLRDRGERCFSICRMKWGLFKNAVFFLSKNYSFLRYRACFENDLVFYTIFRQEFSKLEDWFTGTLVCRWLE